KVDWSKTNVKPSGDKYINSEIINQHCVPVDLMLVYLVDKLGIIFAEGGNKMNRINIANLYVELIDYIFESYNLDRIERIHEVRRFKYILSGSEYIVDLLRKGQGLVNKELI